MSDPQVSSDTLSQLHRMIAHAIECNLHLMPVEPKTLAALVECAEALKKVCPYMEAAESAGLVGDEGCHWPVEEVRAALTALEAL